MDKEKLEIENQVIINRYLERLRVFGYNNKTLGWFKNRQRIRFEGLFSNYNFNNKSILDVGNGLSDYHDFISQSTMNFKYSGIDLVNEFVIYSAKKLKHFNDCSLIHGDFLVHDFSEKYDIVFGSGLFNQKYENFDNYEYVNNLLKKAYDLSNELVVFDFLTSYVDFRTGHNFYYEPEKIYEMASRISRRLILNQGYLPWEFSITIFVDNQIDNDLGTFKFSGSVNNE